MKFLAVNQKIHQRCSGFRERPLSYRANTKFFPTETDDYRHTEGYHKVHAKDTLSSRYFPKNREIKLKKPDKVKLRNLMTLLKNEIMLTTWTNGSRVYTY